MRTVPTWIGKTDDSKPPKHVRLRIFDRCGGRCHLSGLKIKVGDEWDLDHVKPLWDGGANSEANLAPALKDKHRLKSAADQSIQAKTDRIRARHFGVRETSPGFRQHPTLKRGVDGKVRPRNVKDRGAFDAEFAPDN